MQSYTVDLAGVRRIDELHDRLGEGLRLPDWYGRNLDALFDHLTEMEGQLFIDGIEEIDEDLKPYVDRFRAVLQDAKEANPLIQIVIGS